MAPLGRDGPRIGVRDKPWISARWQEQVWVPEQALGPFTALPGGSGRNFTWMLTAGIGIPIGGSIHLDLSYRYTDAGEIRTDVGDIAIQCKSLATHFCAFLPEESAELPCQPVHVFTVTQLAPVKKANTNGSEFLIANNTCSSIYSPTHHSK